MLNGRLACLAGHPCEPVDHKEVQHCASHHLPSKTYEQVCDEIGKTPRQLNDCFNANEPDWLSTRHLSALLAATKERPILARYYARRQGGLFVPLPQAPKGTQAEVFAGTSELLKQLSEGIEAIQRRVADGHITKREAREIDPELDDIIVAVEALRGVVHRNAVEDAPLPMPRAIGGRR